ncbi:MAG TPA: (2Fe-2S)-binding protein [Thermoanaerobaculia bacterium]|nr:(2Fe-2S)-binding protein [Thermoanaerobaculia bacterium]
MEEDDQTLHPAILSLKTVCRCNNIKYKTIAKAICDGARSIAEVAAKTTATTGHCGGSCTPNVAQMIEESE